MLIYTDLSQVDEKYQQSVVIAYMKNIARGRGGGILIRRPVLHTVNWQL